MGTVLAMRIWAKLLSVIAGVALVGACSNEPVDTTNNAFIYGAGESLWSSLRGKPEESFSLTRAQLAGVTFSVLWVEALKTGAEGSAIPIGTNGDAVTWTTANAVTMVTKDDILFGTRGLGADLLTTETERVQEAVRTRRSGSYPRVYRFLAGDESIRKERYFCELENDGPATREILHVTHRTTQLRESCYAFDGTKEFRNIYWVGSNGVIWESLQWIGPQSGFLRIQRLVR